MLDQSTSLLKEIYSKSIGSFFRLGWIRCINANAINLNHFNSRSDSLPRRTPSPSWIFKSPRRRPWAMDENKNARDLFKDGNESFKNLGRRGRRCEQSLSYSDRLIRLTFKLTSTS